MIVAAPGTNSDATPYNLPAVQRRRGAFMDDALTQSERKAIADSIEENREALEIMAKR